jgi:hypothetical protein
MDRATAFFADIWDLGSPIDVARFFKRADIPEDAKLRVRQAALIGKQGASASNQDADRLMQARILDEVVRLGLPGLPV